MRQDCYKIGYGLDTDFISRRAAKDLKSLVEFLRAGSSPAFGTLFSRRKRRDFLFVKTTFAPISINSKTCIFMYILSSETGYATGYGFLQSTILIDRVNSLVYNIHFLIIQYLAAGFLQVIQIQAFLSLRKDIFGARSQPPGTIT